MELLAVYGNLRKGLSNHGVLASSTFIGTGATMNRYTFYVNGLPFLAKDISEDSLGAYVEVYKVDRKTLFDIDVLAGHPRLSIREKVIICFDDNPMANECLAWTYFHVGKNPKRPKIIFDYTKYKSLF